MSKLSTISSRATQTKKVVIVGAGLAGLAAAHTLTNTKQDNINIDVKLLEAKSTPGGRVKSVQLEEGKHTTELGAFYLYYYSNATGLTDFAVRKRLASGKVDGTFDEVLTETYIPNVHLLSDGQEIEHTCAKYYEQIYFDVLEELQECSKCNDWSYEVCKEWPKKNKKTLNPDGISVAEYLKIRFYEAVQASPSLPLPMGCSAKHIFQRMMTYQQFMDGTMDLSDLDILAYGNFHEPDGQYTHKESYHDIVSSIIQDLPPHTLKCNTEVQSIEWVPKNTQSEQDTLPVTIVCADGNIYKAHHIIVTVSLGVLKRNCKPDKMFKPMLLQEKLDAISKLGMGEGCSVLVGFKAPLLDKEHSVIELFWLEEDQDYPTNYHWARLVDALIRVGNSNTYGAWFTAENARAIEGASDHDIGEGLRLVLEKFLRKNVGRPVTVKRSYWVSDPHILGSYSYYANGSDKRDRIALSEPISGSSPLQILFAGEATHPTCFSTTNGAYETGVQEAQRLLKHYTTNTEMLP